MAGRPCVDSACFALLLGAFAGCQTTSEDRLHEGDELLFRRDYDGAAKIYEAVVVESAPDSSDADADGLRIRALMGLAHVRHHFLDDAEGALRAYRAVMESAPGTTLAFDARRDTVRLLRDRMGDVEGAVTELASMIEAYPDRPETPVMRLELASLAFRAGQYSVAEAQARALIDRPADSAVRREAKLLLGSVQALGGRSEEALVAFRALLAEPLDAPTQARVRFEIAMCLETLGRLDEAVAAYEQARAGAHDPDVISARADRARAKSKAKNRPRL